MLIREGVIGGAVESARAGQDLQGAPVHLARVDPFNEVEEVA